MNVTSHWAIHTLTIPNYNLWWCSYSPLHIFTMTTSLVCYHFRIHLTQFEYNIRCGTLLCYYLFFDLLWSGLKNSWNLAFEVDCFGKRTSVTKICYHILITYFNLNFERLTKITQVTGMRNIKTLVVIIIFLSLPLLILFLIYDKWR